MNERQVQNAGTGRLMGHVNYDAGLVRYRQLLRRSNEAAEESPRAAGRVLGSRRYRRAATVVAAIVLLLGLAVAGAAQECNLRFCPGFGGYGAEEHSIESLGPAEVAVTAVAEGELAIEWAAWRCGGGGGSACYSMQAGGCSQFTP